jgi:hypothetical protein
MARDVNHSVLLQMTTQMRNVSVVIMNMRMEMVNANVKVESSMTFIYKPVLFQRALKYFIRHTFTTTPLLYIGNSHGPRRNMFNQWKFLRHLALKHLTLTTRTDAYISSSTTQSCLLALLQTARKRLQNGNYGMIQSQVPCYLSLLQCIYSTYM